MIKIKFTDNDKYYNVSFARTSEHVVTLQSNNTVRTMRNTSGFRTYKAASDGVVLLGDFTQYSTVYRVTDTYIQYSNDGSVWEAPKEATRDVLLAVQWDDEANTDELRPENVTVTIDGNHNVSITAADDWSVVLKDVPVSITPIVTMAEEVDGYTTTIEDCVITYTHEVVDMTPSLEDRVTDIEDAVIELYDLMILTMEGDE